MTAPASDIAKVRLPIPQGVDIARITGPADALFRTAERRCEASVTLRGGTVVLSGPVGEVDLLTRLFTHVIQAAGTGISLTPDDVDRAIDSLRQEDLRATGPRDDVLLSYRGKVIRPKTPGQQRYIDAIREHTVTFCTGPAGTGKTYLAMAMAVSALQRHDVGRIVLTRPVVEAGENLGFLPGTLEEKVDPYVRPLYDALFDMMDAERAHELVERGVVEIAPLAYMRGRTLNDAFVILDEAQNTTPEQMKMFLTRLGFNSTFVITGDATQRDLPGKRGGLVDAQEILSGVDGIAFVELARADVVRHRLVGKIVEAYELFEAGREAGAHEGSARAKAGKEGRHVRAHQ
ncbi:PhoH family protein [Collinsella stercoris]|uniref:PhoH family protein n=1 Tax=Collinsella stercoris TaxID=147206 RepID=UPI003AF0EB01